MKNAKRPASFWQKWNPGRLLENDQIAMLLSLVLACLAWYGVVTTVDDQTTSVLRDIPIQINAAESSAAQLGLSLIEIEPKTIDVEVTGRRNIVGNLTADNVAVYAIVSGVTGAGSFDLRLECYDLYQQGFSCTLLGQHSTLARFDHIASVTVPVELELKGVTIPDGYIRGTELLGVSSITLRGPEADVSRAARAVVRANLDRTLATTTSLSLPVTLLDADGSEFHSQFATQDYATVDVTIPVLKKKLVPVTVDFLNAPSGFSPETFGFTLSTPAIEIAGNAELVDKFEEIHLGYIDLRELDQLSEQYHFKVNLPGGYVNVEGILEVQASFDTELLSDTLVSVSTFELLNLPPDYEVSISTKQLSEVKLVGRSESIELLSEDEVTAQIDMSRIELLVGQCTVPVNITVAGQDEVWAYGEYTAVIVIKEQEE